MLGSREPVIGFHAHVLEGGTGLTWTLTTLLGRFLLDAEKQFGPRNRAWTILGIEFNGDTPHIWYPGNVGHISIVLTDRARSNHWLAIYQLAHEVVHLISPSGGPARASSRGRPGDHFCG